ncbi:hypothetical protein N7451_006390 [Penicillium sp. IBT 35674x]|nr:hypothetical protein N7451_006390 [Penicillium sp. IBT 35674x]
MAECLLAGAGEVNKGDWSSATVLLGLTPSILGIAAPTIEERLQLLKERPLLGFLSILAAPSLMFSRPWIKPDHPDEKKTGWIRKHFSGKNPKAYWTVVQYLSVALAAANVIENTIRLGHQTIINWKCNVTYLELLWVLLAPVPPLVALMQYLGPISKKPKKDEDLKQPEDHKTPGNPKGVEATETNEASETNEAPKEDSHEGLFDSFANICGLIHVVFGTIVLSSVQFIGTLDALGVVGRFAASALVVQFITMTQLYGKPNDLTKLKRFERLDKTNFRKRVYGMDGNDLEQGA